MQLRVTMILAGAFLLPLGGTAQSFEITEVADGVYAAIGRPGVASNGAFVVLEDSVLVVDTHLRPSWARDLLAEIHKVTDKPVRYVVNTHWHNDHTQGNQVYVNAFGRNVEYLAQHTTRDDIAGVAIPHLRQQISETVPANIAGAEKALADGVDLQGDALNRQSREQLERQLANQRSYLEELRQIEITLPTLTFERSLILHSADRPVHIYHFGRAHTRGDVVVYLPKQKVVVTGDLLTNGIPFMRDAYPSQWDAVLESIRSLDWEHAIPGHGGVQQGKEQIGKLIAYLREMVAAVRKAIDEGMTLEQALERIDLGRHAASFPNFANGSPSAVRRTWAELTGAISD
jgi:cyclase